MSEDNLYTFPAVRRWLGNPLSRYILNFMIQKDRCGDRLINAIDYYLDPSEKHCWKCNLAGHVLSYVLQRSGKLFDIDEKDMRAGLANPIFQRGLSDLLQGIERYGITMPQLVDAPFLVVWDITHLCNLRCVHCYQDAHQALPHELDTDEAKKLIDELYDDGVVIIAFSGGEPLMHKDFFEIAAYAHKKGLYLALATNATLITQEVAHKIREVGIEYVEISVDGKDAESHDSFRGMPGAFEKTIAGIRNCVAEGLYTCIATTVTSSNYDQIPEIYKLASELRVKRLMCFNFIPTGRGAAMTSPDISPEMRKDLIESLLAQNKDRGEKPEALTTAPQIASVAVEDDKDAPIPVGHFYGGEGIAGQTSILADFIGGCGAGRLYCSIEPEGDVFPCVFMPLKVGNIREKSFSEIWHTSEVLRQLRDRSKLSGACGKCPEKFICGGCRARAWAYFGDLNAPDPGCVHNEKYWDELQSEEGAAGTRQ